jgi:hypothetical protein
LKTDASRTNNIPACSPAIACREQTISLPTRRLGLRQSVVLRRLRRILRGCVLAEEVLFSSYYIVTAAERQQYYYHYYSTRMSVSSHKQRFSRQWRLFHQNEWSQVELASSLDASLQCECCGKGHTSGRGVVRAKFVTLWESDLWREKWVCLYCLAGVLRLNAEVVLFLRQRYRQQYNDTHFGALTDILLPLARSNNTAAEYIVHIHNNKSVPPALLSRARKLANEIGGNTTGPCFGATSAADNNSVELGATVARG